MGNESQSPEGASCTFLKRAVEQTTRVFVSNIITMLLECTVVVFATTSNALIASVIWRTKSLHCPSNTLLCCLAVTDFLTGLVVAPLNIATKLGEIKRNTRLYCVAGVAGSLATWIVASVVFLTLTLISMERYLALRLHLRYKTLVTSKRILNVFAFVWIFMTALCLLRFWDIKEIYVRPIVIINIVISLVLNLHCYRKIYELVQHHREKIRTDSSVNETSSSGTTLEIEHSEKTKESSANKLEIARYRRSTLTMVYIVGCFLICYLPILTYQVVVGLNRNSDESTLRVVYRCCVTVALIKSALNPLLYCLRLKDIRIASKRTLKIWSKRLTRQFPSFVKRNR